MFNHEAKTVPDELVEPELLPAAVPHFRLARLASDQLYNSI